MHDGAVQQRDLVTGWLALSVQSRSTDQQFQLWSRGDYKARRFYIRREWSSRSTEFSHDCRDAVWRRWALKRSHTAKDAANASGKL